MITEDWHEKKKKGSGFPALIETQIQHIYTRQESPRDVTVHIHACIDVCIAHMHTQLKILKNSGNCRALKK